MEDCNTDQTSEPEEEIYQSEEEEEDFSEETHTICRRARLMLLLISGYPLYSKMCFYRDTTRLNIDYETAEEMAEILEEYTGKDIQASDLLFDKNEQADNAIEFYKDLQEYLAHFDQDIQDEVMAFYHHLHYNRSCTSDFLPGWEINYPTILGTFLGYAAGFTTKKELKNSFLRYNCRTDEQEVVDSCFFRKDIMILANIYMDIHMKRKARRKKAEE